MIEPALALTGSISIGSVASNTSHIVSARRNNAAGVAAEKANVKLTPSPPRPASTGAAPLPAAVAGGGPASAAGSDAARVIFCDLAAAGAGSSVAGCSGFGVSGAGVGAASGLISIFAGCADVSGVGGVISPD